MLSWLWKSCCAVWKAWIRGDAIRSSSTERVWLSLQPPCVMVWQGERIHVLHRRETPAEQGPILRFECLTPRGREDLVVHPGGLHLPPTWEWNPP